jgi:uncharacterized protein
VELLVQHEERGQQGMFFIRRDEENVAEMTYRREGAVAIIDHTEVLPALRGRGVARKLVDAAVEWARSNGIRLEATCSYAVLQLKRMS